MPINSFSLNGSRVEAVISCLSDDDTGGGLFRFDGSRIERLDSLSSTGLCLWDTRAVRLLRSTESTHGVAEMLIYDQKGVERYFRIDTLIDPHDVLWDGEHFAIACSATNRIVWISAAGSVVRSWQAPGEGDCWHLNSLLAVGGRLAVCAFGRFASSREWASCESAATGVVFDLESGRDLIAGLSRPHHPRFVDGYWVVCNSARNELLRIDPATGRVDKRIAMAGWTRGLCVTDDYLLAGESSLRRSSPKATASVTVICRKTWRVLKRLPLPCLEIYDIVAMPPALVEGMRAGFRTNQMRVAEQDQYELFRQAGVQPSRLWAVAEPLPAEACRVLVEADVPAVLPPGSRTQLDCKVTNLGNAILVSAPPHPVHLSVRWESPEIAAGAPKSQDRRFRLPSYLPPGEQVICRLTLETPLEPGTYQIHLTLLQEQVAWFEDLDPANALVRTVLIEPATAVVAERAAIPERALHASSREC